MRGLGGKIREYHEGTKDTKKLVFTVVNPHESNRRIWRRRLVMTEFLHQPGFLGTNANFAADMTLVLSVLVATLFSVGFYLARKGRYDTQASAHSNW